ncbi:HK97-gp10 family putative phage morphogenesis protein [Arsukibacterium sp. UBA3155]|uniref:HK97-gp10 family putative phage morphogenesis protein n=1 Tax=Arsukibacterium sp. UBA3155 TaxID=1946058 RepID=UPI0025BA8061|nr:HK97-gp10 family putative phage morphogenesis protein [Arsukibacterium sp. UBA3155]|tara:strand:- start:33411 stop:34037 length:627 start_codon:yes stop_codon:yes gene_type:complete
MSGPLFKITGLNDALKRMANTSPKQQGKAYRSAARSSMLPVRNAVRNGARRVDNPATNRSIAANVAVRSMPRRKLRSAGGRVGDIGISVGILGGARQYAETKENRRKGRAGQTYKTGGSRTNPGGDTWYWRLIEFGRSAFKTGTNSVTGKRVNLFNPVTGSNFGFRVKGVPAKAFMQPALPKNINSVMDRLAKRLTAIINKSANGRPQ